MMNWIRLKKPVADNCATDAEKETDALREKAAILRRALLELTLDKVQGDDGNCG